jgi:tetratricopeptide (TPR) repeat protein
MVKKLNQPIPNGVKAQAKGNLDLAICFFQQAIEENPKKELAYTLIDKVLRESGRLEEANQYYHCVSKTTPTDWNEEYHLGLRIGEIENATIIPLANQTPRAPMRGGIKINGNYPTISTTSNVHL